MEYILGDLVELLKQKPNSYLRFYTSRRFESLCGQFEKEYAYAKQLLAKKYQSGEIVDEEREVMDLASLRVRNEYDSIRMEWRKSSYRADLAEPLLDV